MSAMTLIAATQAGLAEEMRRDPRVWALGEDLARGGVFGQYAGFLEEFGPKRIVSTPISEAMIMSAGLGAALAGTRPVVEMRIADFTLCAMDELVNQVAKVRYMFGGQARAPMVIRMPHGLARYSAAQHSQSLEAWLVHVPGLVVLAPATAADCKGLMKAAIRCDDPVVLFEPRAIWAATGEVPDGDHATPIGAARIARAGSDVTLVSWSMTVPIALEAAEAAAREGVSVEVIDLRSLWPWDRTTVLDSVARTRRVVVAHEAVRVAGFGAEIAATIAEELADVLAAPVHRVGAPRIPVPYAPQLEDVYRVTSDRILAGLRQVVRGKSARTTTGASH
ncbi:MAG: alpha-ketoacid dehydrogenase subunit beta [Alphaproteobacteria bacterium]|nr:alpha-ketoacid dehydrogenase subunit beta [Alphaproteobacteria bacterium]